MCLGGRVGGIFLGEWAGGEEVEVPYIDDSRNVAYSPENQILKDSGC